MKIIKIFFLLSIMSQVLFSATEEQVEQYISVSNSEEQLLVLERQFTQMQNSINRMRQNKEDVESSNYDMQLLTIRFREYLQKNISEDEMEEILNAYRKVVLLKFASVQNDTEYDEEEAKAYKISLKNEENATVRLDLLEKISKKLYTVENIEILFDNLMKPFLNKSMGGADMSDERLKKNKETYIKNKIEAGKLETLYMTREFTLDELESLLDIVKIPAIEHESKAVFGATAYALQEFFLSMASRYDPSKHKK